MAELSRGLHSWRLCCYCPSPLGKQSYERRGKRLLKANAEDQAYVPRTPWATVERPRPSTQTSALVARRNTEVSQCLPRWVISDTCVGRGCCQSRTSLRPEEGSRPESEV